jgi:uncharacterized protein
MPNALLHEKSPYLQQHAHNPVDWLPWGEEAFQKAERENKPIFLSIGYSTCHWCHVMERESFENESIAALLNRYFISIKVDREERPDVDRVYMLFVQASTGSGGWPMSVFLTPDRKPFFGGTYFPPDARYGRAGFPDILQQLAQAWRDRRDDLVAASERVHSQLQDYVSSSAPQGELGADLFHAGFAPFRRSFDRQFGGFGSAPKFPRPVAFNFLLREYAAADNGEALEMVVKTLKAMALGGMNDQLGGGFHRYSVDRLWFVPHFEKMLYDQAQLAWSYLEAFQVTGDAELKQTAEQIFAYVLRDMRHPEGGFYSAEDADSVDPDQPSHKGEGAFYIWRQKEIEEVLGADTAARFAHRYGIQPDGNVTEDPHGEFTGRNILYQANSLEETAVHFQAATEELTGELEASRRVLFDRREKRPRPHLDDKILTSWNALMISAFAKAAQVLENDTYLPAAQRAAGFILQTMYAPETGRLLRRFREGEAAVNGFLDDYAFLAQALLDLYEADFNPAHLRTAVQLMKTSIELFEDSRNGGFFSTGTEGEALMLRIKDDYDGAEPSGNSVATDVLLRLAHLTGDDDFRVHAEKSLKSFAPKLREQPVQAPQMLVALGRYLSEPAQLVIRCEQLDDRVKGILKEHRQREWKPNLTCAVVTDTAVDQLGEVAPFLASLERKGAVTIYECANFVCQLPRVLD